MAKQINAVLKLKDSFSSPMKMATKSLKEFERTGKVSEKTATALKKSLGASLKKAALGTAAAITAMGVATTKLVKKTAEYTDHIDKTSQKIGISYKAYQEWNYAMSICGTNVDLLKVGVKKLTNMMAAADKGTESATDTFKRLGVNIYDANHQLRNQEDVLKDTLKGLADMENKSERAALASQLFGKAGSELAPLLNQGSKGIDALIKKANDLGLVMDDTAIKQGAEATDRFYELNQTFKIMKMTIGSKLLPQFISMSETILSNMPTILKVTKFVSKAFEGFANAMKWCVDHSKTLIPILAGAVGLFSAFKVVSIVSNAIKTFTTITKAYAAAQGVANVTMLACPITWIALGIGALVTAGVLLWKNWDKVCKWANKLKTRLENLIKPIKTAWNWLKKLFGVKAKDYNVNVTRTVRDRQPGEKAGGKHATGTNYFVGGRTRINEGGRPEEAILPSGTKIIPASKSGIAPSKNVNVTVNVQGNMIGNREAMEQFAEFTGRKIMLAMGNV